jgi:6-phosphogluconolactonase
MPHTLHLHATPDALASAVAAAIDARIDAALAERGHALLALAGGRTSPPVFRRLAARPRDWSTVTALPSDERWVGRDHPDCNLTQLRGAIAAATGIRTLGLVPEQPQGAVAADYANAALAPYADLPFDVTLLGMGADGHFGSLFPGAPTLMAALDLAQPAAAMEIVPDPMPVAGPHPRVSLTLARMLRSRAVLLAITGADKRAVLERAVLENDPRHLPVAALLHAPGAAIAVHWSP